MNTVNIKQDPVVEARGDFEEDFEHGFSSKLTEEEAIAMILSDYVPDNVRNYSRSDDDIKEEIELRIDEAKEGIENEMHEMQQKIDKIKKTLEDVIKRMSSDDDEDNVSHILSRRKRQICSVDREVVDILESPAKKSNVESDNEDK